MIDAISAVALTEVRWDTMPIIEVEGRIVKEVLTEEHTREYIIEVIRKGMTIDTFV